MTVLDKIKAFFKLYAKWYQKVSEQEAKDAEPPETKVAEAPEKKGDESGSK